jgi:hypothetical protein
MCFCSAGDDSDGGYYEDDGDGDDLDGGYEHTLAAVLF